MPDSRGPLVLVSNRGPVTFEDDGSVKRGTGGLVTALTGLASHRDAVWIASALTEGDARKAREADGRAFAVRSPAGGEYQVRLVASDADAYDRFYNVFANPMLWFIQHYLWDLSNAPDIRRNEVEAFEYGYNVVNEDLATAVIEEIEDGVSGYLVDSVEACAARTLDILRDPALGKTLGRRGKEHVRKHFLTPRYLRDYLKIFTELLAEA